MKLGSTIADFISNPFDPNKDGKTSAVELFFVLGLVAILTIVWKRILSFQFQE